MLNILAHTGNAESMTTMTYLDYCTPIIIGTTVVIVFLLLVIAYLVNTWQPKSFTEGKKKSVPAKKKSTKK